MGASGTSIQTFFDGVKFGNKKFGPKINTHLPLYTDDPIPSICKLQDQQ